MCSFVCNSCKARFSFHESRVSSLDSRIPRNPLNFQVIHHLEVEEWKKNDMAEFGNSFNPPAIGHPTNFSRKKITLFHESPLQKSQKIPMDSKKPQQKYHLTQDLQHLHATHPVTPWLVVVQYFLPLSTTRCPNLFPTLHSSLEPVFQSPSLPAKSGELRVAITWCIYTPEN